MQLNFKENGHETNLVQNIVRPSGFSHDERSGNEESGGKGGRGAGACVRLSTRVLLADGPDDMWRSITKLGPKPRTSAAAICMLRLS